MKQYLNNLLPRIKQFSESLDKKESFIDTPWVIVDEDLNQQKYIFKRNGELIMSLNGQVSIGKWEYLSTAKSLLIDRNQDKILLNQFFVDPAVMVLSLDGRKEDYLILANEILVPDLDVTGYLKRLYYQKNNIATRRLKTGELLELSFGDTVYGSEVKIEGQPVSDGFVESAEPGKKYVIKDSKIIKVLVMEKFNTNKGEIVVETKERDVPSNGDFVFQNNDVAPDGKYRLGFMWNIVVKNGRVV
jgi:hypothetical protein